MNYWLFKSEPNTFGIQHLKKRPRQTTHWDGVRNYQVRNMLRDEIKIGDLCFFYHSNCMPPGIVGTAKVVREGYPDSSALDPDSKYFDSLSTSKNPRWFMVDIQLVEQFPKILTLEEIKQDPHLSKMQVARKGNRLSISRVTKQEWDRILKLARS